MPEIIIPHMFRCLARAIVSPSVLSKIYTVNVSRQIAVGKLNPLLLGLILIGAEAFAQPANDDCANAEVLTVQALNSCGTPALNYTTEDATNSLVSESICTQNAVDVWFEVSTFATNVVYMHTQNGAASDLIVEVYTGNCGTLNLLECGVRPDGQLDLSGHLMNAILVRVYHAGAHGTFGICFSGEASCTQAQYTVGCSNPTYGGDIDGISVNGFSVTGDGCQGGTGVVDRTVQAIRFTENDNGTLQLSGSFPLLTYSGVWIDYNDDLDFESGEFITGTQIASQGNTIEQPFSISPGTAGTHRMRVRVLPGFDMTGGQACEKFQYGETHDYTAIIAPNPCGVSDIDTDGCNPQVGHYIHELQVADLTQGGTFCENSNFGTADYTNLEVNVEPGNSYNYVVSTFDHQSIPSTDHYVGWWIDFNDDGDFDDVGEFVGNDGPSTTYQNTGNITIPISAPGGTHRMRVRYVYQQALSAGNACTPYANGETQDYSAVVTLPPGPCLNQYTDGCTPLRMINTVTVADLNDTNTGCSGGNTIDDRTATMITMEQGRNHPYTLQCGTFMGTAWWIDFNDDDEFSASESVASSGSISGSTHTGALEIPADAPLGNHRLRVRAVASASPGTGDACTVYFQGETHEYTVNIVPAYCIDNLHGTNNCTGNSFAIDDIAVGDLDQTGTGCTGVFGSADYTNIDVYLFRDRDLPFTIVHPNSPSSADKYTGWWIDLNDDLSFDGPGEFIGSSMSPPSGDVTGTINIPASAPLGSHRMRVRLTNQAQNAGTACEEYALGETHDYTAVIEEVPPYCSLDLYGTGGSEGCGFGDDIDDVNVADLVHTGTGCTPGGGLSDYTNITVHMDAGTGYPFTITTHWSPDEYIGWWADFNDDGDFEDAGEFIGSSGPSVSTTITGMVNIPANAPDGNHRMRVRLVAGTAQSLLTSCTMYTYGEAHDYTLRIGDPELQLSVHAVLEGPYDASTGLMDDALRSLGGFPLTEPYSDLDYIHVGGGGETILPAVLAVTGDDAIVDWVVVELRDATNSSIISATRSALLQRDGDVVDVDGTSPVSFDAPTADHYVAVRHRNHLGVMTFNTVSVSAVATTVDLRLGATAVFGVDARRSVVGDFPAEALWAGDANFSGDALYTGDSNDRDLILQAIGGEVPTNSVSGYLSVDLNLDGIVLYTGQDNDRDIILQAIGGTVPTNVRVEQLP